MTIAAATDSANNAPDVVGAEPKTAIGAGGSSSFDLIERIENSKPKPKDDSKMHGVKGDKDEDNDSGRDKSDKTEKSKSDKPKSDKPEESTKPRKTFKAKDGEKEIELDEELQVPIPVNGKMTWVPFSEAKAAYSSKAERTRLYQEFQKSKQEHEESVRVSNENFQQLLEAATDAKNGGDPRQFFHMMAKLGGHENPDQFFDDFMKNIEATVTKIQSMSEADRKVFEAEQKAKGLELRLERDNKAKQISESRKQRIAILREHQQAYALTEEEMNIAAATLAKDGDIHSLEPGLIVQGAIHSKLSKGAGALMPELINKWTTAGVQTDEDRELFSKIGGSLKDLTQSVVDGLLTYEDALDTFKEYIADHLPENQQRKRTAERTEAQPKPQSKQQQAQSKNGYQWSGRGRPGFGDLD